MNNSSAVRLAAIGEDELIRRFTTGLPLGPEVVAGAGDDCAIVHTGRKGQWQLLKTDAVVENVHFTRDVAPGQTGWKAMARVVSDIASMGGTPQHALITLVLPPDLEIDHATGLYAGLRRCAETFGISIVGGETTRGPFIIISVCLTGTVKPSECIRRDGARVGDFIYVTGKLGGSIKGHHLTFIPRLAEARWLCSHFSIHAMMDLSDGLAKDLPRLARASALGFQIQPDALPRNPGCTPADAWSDGEDYELLFCVSPGTASRLAIAWQQQFPDVSLTKIGRMVAAAEGISPDIPGSGWDAFAVIP